MIAPLFTERGLHPLRTRRLVLTLRYLAYILGQPQATLISKALSESVSLAEMGKHSWVADLQTTISSFSDGSLALPDLRTSEADAIAALIKKIERLSVQKLQLEIDSLPKAYLLRNRLEPDNDGVLSQRVACFRHYLHIQNAQHRQALT